jgi:hypothetical protein
VIDDPPTLRPSCGTTSCHSASVSDSANAINDRAPSSSRSASAAARRLTAISGAEAVTD